MRHDAADVCLSSLRFSASCVGAAAELRPTNVVFLSLGGDWFFQFGSKDSF